MQHTWSRDSIASGLIPRSRTICDTDLVFVEINDLDARRESHSVTQLDKPDTFSCDQNTFSFGAINVKHLSLSHLQIT